MLLIRGFGTTKIALRYKNETSPRTKPYADKTEVAIAFRHQENLYSFNNLTNQPPNPPIRMSLKDIPRLTRHNLRPIKRVQHLPPRQTQRRPRIPPNPPGIMNLIHVGPPGIYPQRCGGIIQHLRP